MDKTKKKKKLKRKGLDPTLLQGSLSDIDITETEHLYKSSLFKLQLDDLVKDLKIKEKRKTEFHTFYKNFKSFLDNVPEHETIKLSYIKEFKSLKTKKSDLIESLHSCSYEHFNCDDDVDLSFIKPHSHKIFTNLDLTSNYEVYIAVKMPKSCFRLKDYLNNRYYTKRFYYLLYLGIELRKKNICTKIENSYYNGNRFVPILILTPNVSEKIRVKLFIIPEEGSFKLSRFVPQTNNIKLKNKKNVNETGTPLYNSSVLHDLTFDSNWSYLEEILGENKNARDALKLVKLWLHRRNLDKILGGFTDELLLYTFCYLVKKGKAEQCMNISQIVRNVWNFLKTSDWSKEPIYLCEEVKLNNLDIYKNEFDIVFLDFTGYYNIAAFMSKEIYEKIKDEAERALKSLDEEMYDTFEDLFIRDLPWTVQFDAILR